MAVSNPYIAGSPVRGRGRFIGRIDVLRDVARVLQNPNTNALVLFGQRRIGKTSVLLHIERELATQKQFTPFYFDLQDKAALPLPEVLYRMAQKVSVATKIPLPRREQFDHEGRYFKDTFIPAATKTSKNRGLVLLLDEFDALDITPQDQIGPAFAIYLRDWMKSAQSVQFIFVLGRRPEELSVNALSTFKSIHSRKVSLMNQEDSTTVIRQSEREGSLRWSDEAVDRVWYWTQGHPYFMQLLCSGVWEAIIEENPENPRPVMVEAVDTVIDAVLERGSNALQWIWNSLSPAERVVMAAMAESRGEYINQDELTDILNRSKVRLILRELEVAPETLIRWDLLRPVSSGFRFAVPLLRRWVSTEKPLRLVKTELDNLEPLAENLYRSGEGFYTMGNLDEAERQLRNALNVNPNHFRARLMLGQVLVGQGNPSAAVEELEPAYEFDPPSAKPGLIGALLSLSETQNENEQLSTFNRILAIDPVQPTAIKKKQAILRERADTSERNEDLDAALKLYQQIDDKDSVARIQRKLRKREVDAQLVLIRKYEEVEDWSSAIGIYQKLLIKYPEDGDWQSRLNDARTQARLLETYTRAVNVLQQGDSKLAQRLFGNILGMQPDYKDAAVYLVMASRGLKGEALLQELRLLNLRPPEPVRSPQPEPPNQTTSFANSGWYPYAQERPEPQRYTERAEFAENPLNFQSMDRREAPVYGGRTIPPEYPVRPEYYDRPERREYRSNRPERTERPKGPERRDVFQYAPVFPQADRSVPTRPMDAYQPLFQAEWPQSSFEQPVYTQPAAQPIVQPVAEPKRERPVRPEPIQHPVPTQPARQPAPETDQTGSQLHGLSEHFRVPAQPVSDQPIQKQAAPVITREPQPSQSAPLEAPNYAQQATAPVAPSVAPESPATVTPPVESPKSAEPEKRSVPPQSAPQPIVQPAPQQTAKPPRAQAQPKTTPAQPQSTPQPIQAATQRVQPATPPVQSRTAPPQAPAQTSPKVRPNQPERSATTARQQATPPTSPANRQRQPAKRQRPTPPTAQTAPVRVPQPEAPQSAPAMPQGEPTPPVENEFVELIEPIEPIVPPDIALSPEEVESDLGQEFRFDVIIVNERGEEITHRRGKAYQQVDDLGGILLEMVYIPGGTYLMGSPADEEGRGTPEDPQHQVTVLPFYMGKFPVTQAQWNLIMERNPSRFKGSTRPVENVSWKDAMEFCKRIAQKTGRPYRLPNEAEWEYACRAGTTTPFHFGKTIMPVLANYDCRAKYAAGLKGTFRKKTTTVGSFSPNAFGLYDLHGNVWEWCADLWHPNYQGAPTDGSAWNSESNNPFRIIRGGSWCNEPRDCRSASRERNEFDSWFNNAIGFRLVVSASGWRTT